jgi:Bacterial archaeo-eukaryotic release factor family 2
VEPLEVIPSGLGPSDWPDLADIYRRSGPFVTVYFDPGTSSQTARREAGVRWEDMSRQLEGQGVARPAVDTMARALSQASGLDQRAEGVCVVQSNGEVLLLEAGPIPLDHDFARVGALPALGLAFEWRQHSIPYVTVRCDRAGADIILYGRRADVLLAAGEQGVKDPLLHEAHSGGSSYPRHERRVENTWERNAKDVVDVLDRLVASARPRLVVFGGDPRACGLLREDASPSLRPLLREVPLSPVDERPPEHDPQAVRAVVEAVEAADTAGVLDRFSEKRSKSLGVDGAGPVLGALTAAQVETLLLRENPDDERVAFMSLEPVAAGLDRQEVAALGGEPFAARLVDVALATTFLTGAAVRMVPELPAEDGMAALLRFPA